MKFESQLLKGVAPVVVLQILSRGPMYGYELSQAIEQRSGEILTLGKGTLYPLLYNLEAKKLVRPSGRRPTRAGTAATTRSPAEARRNWPSKRPSFRVWPRAWTCSSAAP